MSNLITLQEVAVRPELSIDTLLSLESRHRLDTGEIPLLFCTIKTLVRRAYTDIVDDYSVTPHKQYEKKFDTVHNSTEKLVSEAALRNFAVLLHNGGISESSLDDYIAMWIAPYAEIKVWLDNHTLPYEASCKAEFDVLRVNHCKKCEEIQRIITHRSPITLIIISRSTAYPRGYTCLTTPKCVRCKLIQRVKLKNTTYTTWIRTQPTTIPVTLELSRLA